jgi:hypothetical protein
VDALVDEQHLAGRLGVSLAGESPAQDNKTHTPKPTEEKVSVIYTHKAEDFRISDPGMTNLTNECRIHFALTAPLGQIESPQRDSATARAVNSGRTRLLLRNIEAHKATRISEPYYKMDGRARKN